MWVKVGLGDIDMLMCVYTSRVGTHFDQRCEWVSCGAALVGQVPRVWWKEHLACCDSGSFA